MKYESHDDETSVEEHDQVFHNNARIPPLFGLLPEIYHHTRYRLGLFVPRTKKKNHSENMQRTNFDRKKNTIVISFTSQNG